jgi:hypothetical protein
MTITQYIKDISYDRETRDYAMRLDGELVGFARTHYEAEVALDQRVYDLLNDQPYLFSDPCPSCGDPLPTGARLCAACRDDEPTPPDLTTDLYNVVCLTLSGAAATTAISELRRVQQRYEKEVRK